LSAPNQWTALGLLVAQVEVALARDRDGAQACGFALDKDDVALYLCIEYVCVCRYKQLARPLIRMMLLCIYVLSVYICMCMYIYIRYYIHLNDYATINLFTTRLVVTIMSCFMSVHCVCV
jgi:hypothetical protein